MPSSSLPSKLSEDEQITLIVAKEHCFLLTWEVSRVLGYHPDRFELRFFPDQVDEILREHSYGRNCKGSKLYAKWSKDWASCTGQERVEQKRMLEDRMAIVERDLQEAERREVEAGKLRRSSAKSNQERRKGMAEYSKKKKVMEAMALDLKLYEQDAELYEQTVLNSGQAATEKETTGRKIRLFGMVGKKAQSTRVRHGSGATLRKPIVNDSASEVTTLCEKEDDLQTSN